MNTAPRVPAVGLPIGLLGGSFDPVHSGHLQLARDAHAGLGLAQVVFLPAGQPWQKGPITPAAERLAMLELALGDDPRWRIDARELERPGPSYTVDTLCEMRAECGSDQPLVWILGFDQLRGLASWDRWTELIGLAHLAYARRAGVAPTLDPVMEEFVRRHRAGAAQLRDRAAGLVVEFAMHPVDCSASALRARIAAGDTHSAAPFLAPQVLQYIRSHQLYSTAHGS